MKVMNRTVGTSMVLVLVFGSTAPAQVTKPVDLDFATQFVTVLMEDSTQLANYVHPAELAISRRLGIDYEGVLNKFMISFDLDEETRRELRSGMLKSMTSLQHLPGDVTSVTLAVPDRNVTRSYYFDEQRRLISPVRFHTRNWVKFQSRHFAFWVSDTTLFHPEAIAQLEAFVDQMASLLHLTQADLKLLEREKVIYVLCRDEDEIERLTGFKSRGMYMLAYDYLTTTYSCHLHELVHLLVNFKLRRLPLHTHPMLQEGLAVGFGGRGGIAAQSLIQAGVYLCQSGFLNYTDLLSSKSFASADPSLTYPVSGLYVRFLMERLGAEGFLSLYRKYSCPPDSLGSLIINVADIPPDSEWLEFTRSAAEENPIRLTGVLGGRQLILADSVVEILDANDYYHIRATDCFGLRPGAVRAGYTSKRFTEALPTARYRGERYLFIVNESEITIYDLYVDNSIAGFSTGLSLTMERVPVKDGRVEFWVRKSVFAAPLDAMKVVHY